MLLVPVTGYFTLKAEMRLFLKIVFPVSNYKRKHST